MDFTGKPRHQHVKPKRGEVEAPPRESHVAPIPGKEARRRRKQAAKEARLTRPPVSAEGAHTTETRPLIPMTPRPSAARQRSERRRQSSAPTPKPAERVRPRGLIWLSWRWVSGALTAGLLLVLIGMMTSEAFYVSSVAVGGVKYLTREEVFRFSGVSQEHIFWVDPKEVEARLEANSNIAEAQVHVGFPPNLVQIVVRERDPVLTWEQANDRVWVDVNGQVMFQREDRPDLLRIVYDPNQPEAQEPLGPGARIPMETVHGALLLRSRLPTIDVLLYHPIKGLGWRDPRGWMAWFGVGDNMAMKAHVYEALVAYNSDLVQFGEVDISDPDNPVYTILWRKTESQP